MKYIIIASGCDDSTIISIELTEAEYSTVEKVAIAITTASDCGCMPRLYISPLEKADKYEVYKAKDADNGFKRARDDDD